jgi:hypothetical protein
VAVAVAQEVQAVAVALVPGEAAEQERGAEAASVRAETGEACSKAAGERSAVEAGEEEAAAAAEPCSAGRSAR